jgi:outer membrane protein insertion porin family
MKKILLPFIMLMSLIVVTNAFEISKVRFVDQNATEIPYGMFINKIKIKPGMQFSPKLVSDGIKSIYETKKVKDIVGDVIVVDGKYELVFRMTLNVIVTEISFEGNSELDDDDLRSEVKHVIGVPLDMEQLSRDKAKVFELYSKGGHFNTDVEIKSVDSKVAGEVKVIFVISEQKAYQLDNVTIVGAARFESEELVGEFQTQPSFWRYVFDTGFLSESLFKYDLEQLERKYKAHGYLDFKVIDVEKIIDEEYINLVIYIEEGEPYIINDISLNWLKIPGKPDQKNLFTKGDIQPLLDAYKDLPYNGDTERKNIDRMKAKYNNLGHLEFSCRTILKPNEKTRRVDVEYHIYEGTPSVIRDIKIVGNSITHDYVIRRELAIQPTDLSNQLLIDKSKNRLLGLGFFKEADIIPVNTGIEGEKDLIVKVQENETGRLNFGAGVSSASSFIGSVGFQQSNFDLGAGWPYRGGGQKLRASLEAGTQRSRAEISFVEPWLNNKPLSLRTSIYHRSRFFDEYEETHTGISGDLTSTLKSYPGWRFTRGLRIEQAKVDVENDASAELRDEELSDFVSVVYFNFSKDTRNRIRRPTSGGRITLNTEFQSAIIGSANDSYKFHLTGAEYFPVFEESVIRIKGEVGITGSFGGDVPIYDRFFAGGLNSIRGYEFRKVGPLDVNEDELGGESLLLGSIELDVPLFKRVNGALFIDAGNVYKKTFGINPFDINVSMGFGIRLDLPIGTLQLDYGVPIYNVNDADSSGEFHFNFGYQF